MNKIKKYLKEIISFLIMLIIATNIVSYYKSLDLNKEKFDFNNIKLINQTSYKYDKNKNSIIYFWGSWCPICKYQSPNIEELSKEYNILSIAIDSGNNDEIINYLNNQKLTFNTINDTNKKYTSKLNIQAFPTTLIYDKNHNLLFSEIGYTSINSILIKTWFFDLIK
jgi:thiol-disulfide isomerase/thioredoxin